jgi:hypothetical protein
MATHAILEDVLSALSSESSPPAWDPARFKRIEEHLARLTTPPVADLADAVLTIVELAYYLRTSFSAEEAADELVTMTARVANAALVKLGDRGAAKAEAIAKLGEQWTKVKGSQRDLVTDKPPRPELAASPAGVAVGWQDPKKKS